MTTERDDLQEIIDNALDEMARESGGDFDPQTCNLAEFCRRTGLTRSKARTIKSNGFKARPHGRLGLKVAKTVPSGHTGFVDDQLRRGTANRQVIFERLVEQGYRGGLTTVKEYVSAHMHLAEECLASGMTVKDWCAANGVPAATMYVWVRRLREERECALAPTFVELGSYRAAYEWSESHAGPEVLVPSHTRQARPARARSPHRDPPRIPHTSRTHSARFRKP